MSLPDGSTRLLDTVEAAQAAIVDAGGGTRTALYGASAAEMRQQMDTGAAQAA